MNKCIHPMCECLDYCEALDPYSITPTVKENIINEHESITAQQGFDNRKNTTDRRDAHAKAWAAIMADVQSHIGTADRVDQHIADLRATVDRWRGMSTTTKG